MEAKAVERLAILVIILLVASALPGVLSLGFSARHEVVNQYGDVVELYGSGIYAADTYFKAPILIGTDAAILLRVVPLFAWTAWKRRTDGSIESRLRMTGMFAVAAYYAASVALGVKYNALHLLYIALFGCAVFGLAAILRLCLVVGCMMIPQTFFQYLSGVDIPLPALLTKTATFVLLGATAFCFERILYQRLKV